MSSNFGDLNRDLIGGSLYIKGLKILDCNRNLSKIEKAKVGELFVRTNAEVVCNTSIGKDLFVGGNITITGDLIANAGGDLSGTYPNPTVSKINGTSVPSTPSAGAVLTATSGTTSSWQTPAIVTLTSGLFGESLVINGTGPSLQTKGLVAGTNVTLSSNATTIVINSSGGGGNGWVDTATSNLDMDCFTIDRVNELHVGNVFGKSPISKIDIHDDLCIKDTIAGGHILFEGSIIIGDSNTLASNVNQTAIGGNCKTLSTGVAMGYNCHTSTIGNSIFTPQQIAIGGNCTTSNTGVAIGINCHTEASPGYGSLAVGYNCSSKTFRGITVGLDCTVDVGSNSPAVAVGGVCKSTQKFSSSFGYLAKAYGNSSVSIGHNPQADGDYSICVGGGYHGTSSVGDYSICIGTGYGLSTTSKSVGNKSISIGFNTIANDPNTVVIGNSITGNAGGFFVTHRNSVATSSPAAWIGNELIDTVSSERFKNNVRDLEDIGSKIENMRAVRYNPKEGHGNPTEEHIGLIAEELHNTFPEFVVYEDDGVTPRSIMYPQMIAVLLKELQVHRKALKDNGII